MKSPPGFPEAPRGFRWRRLASGSPGIPAGEPLELLVALGFPAAHGFSCRIRSREPGAPPFGVRDQAATDLHLLERATGARVLHSLRQVHGNDVRVFGDGPPPRSLAGDALVARGNGSGVAIKAADCVPVLLADPVSGAVAGAHAGWRGTLARVVQKAARALAREAGAHPARLAAVIGPAIRGCCFEVGAEVVSAFAEGGHDVDRMAVRAGAGVRPHLDLALANRLQLLEAGLREDAIQDASLCTRCEPAFHSYRREGSGVGRNWSVAVVGDPDDRRSRGA